MFRPCPAATSESRAPSAPSPRRTVALLCVSAALLLQSLAPPGYMAGSMDSGWPVVLCPEGLPAGFLGSGAHAHHHEDSGSGEDVSLDRHCPLGSVLDASAALAILPTDHRLPRPTHSSEFHAAPAPVRAVLKPPSRAPPA